MPGNASQCRAGPNNLLRLASLFWYFDYVQSIIKLVVVWSRKDTILFMNDFKNHVDDGGGCDKELPRRKSTDVVDAQLADEINRPRRLTTSSGFDAI